jgi:hypothetical protein
MGSAGPSTIINTLPEIIESHDNDNANSDNPVLDLDLPPPFNE